MGISQLKDKAMGLLHGHKDQAAQGVDKGAGLAKDKIGHEDRVDKAADTAQDKIDDL